MHAASIAAPARKVASTGRPCYAGPVTRPSRLPDRPRRAPRDVAHARSVVGAGPKVELALSIGREGVGLALANPVELGCVRVTELFATLPALRFPVDVSGGVARFRNRRGRLDRAALEIDWVALASHAASRLGGLLGPGKPEVTLIPRDAGASVTVATEDRSGPRVLAFDVLVGARDDGLELVVHRPRGASLPRPAATLAALAVKACLGDLGALEGRAVHVRRLVARVARATFPDGGARTPEASAVTVARLSTTGAGVLLVLERRAAPPADTPDVVRARETAALLLAVDEALVAGEEDRARELATAALARAPRHPDLLATVAGIDALRGREHAAAAALAELSAGGRPILVGTLDADLVAALDPERAVEVYLRAGEVEPAGALAAVAFERAAEHAPTPHDAVEWLGEAIARAPSRPRLLLARMGHAIHAGQLAVARADVDRLEALAATAREKHARLRDAAGAHLASGATAEAAALFERAILFSPDDPLAMGGLGRSLVGLGRHGRGAQLLQRAVERAPDAYDLVIDLAKVVATKLGDVPAAVARLHGVPTESRYGATARRLEGKFRASVGDLAGASLAYARMRDRLEATRDVEHARWLLEAAGFEETSRRDLPAAQRHLATALSLTPGEDTLRRALVRIGEAIHLAQRGPVRAAADVDVEDTVHGSRDDEGPTHVKLPEPAGPAEDAPTEARRDPAGPVAAPVELDDAAAEVRADELTRKLQADPHDPAIADELAALLARLGRSMELFALLAARIEEASPAERERLLPAQRAVLARLAAEAEARGDLGEASLFREALADLKS